jgi:peptidoglycan hydrolase-like protein with peptidoglycan-binding domain
VKQLNDAGFSHILILGAVIVIGGLVGSYLLVTSHADTKCTSRVYRQDDSSNCVKYLQRFTNGAGAAYWKWSGSARITADGDFGPKTTAQIKAYQKFSNLKADGVVGPKTWSSICANAAVIKRNGLQSNKDIYAAYVAAKSAGCNI